MPSSPGHLMPIGVRRVRKATRAQEWRIMLNVITLSQHEKANLTLPLGSGLPRGIHWHLHVNGDTHLGCNRSRLCVLGVHAHANARWLDVIHLWGKAVHTLCSFLSPGWGWGEDVCQHTIRSSFFPNVEVQQNHPWEYVYLTLDLSNTSPPNEFKY